MVSTAYSYNIDSTLSIQVTLDNAIPVLLSPTNLHTLRVVQNIQQYLPTLLLEFDDLSGILTTSYPINDGAILSVTFTSNKDTDNSVKTINFRVLGSPNVNPSGNQSRIKIIAILDALIYLKQIPTNVFTGNSSDVITQIATNCGLTSQVDPTKDYQSWLPGRKTYSQFTDYVVERGYVDPNSFMTLGVDENKNIYYKNLQTLIKSPPQYGIFFGPTQGTIPKLSYSALEYSIKNTNGVLNMLTGYGANIVQENINGTGNEYTKVNVTKDTNYLELNKNIKGNILTRVRSQYYPPDAGNSHNNIANAYYQNARIKSQYSTVLYFLIDSYTPIRLFDIVSCSFTDLSTRDINTTNKGTYIVTAKTRTIVGNRYYEKIQLSTTGKNINPSTQML